MKGPFSDQNQCRVISVKTLILTVQSIEIELSASEAVRRLLAVATKLDKGNHNTVLKRHCGSCRLLQE
jgi:hypothetical protein